MKIAKHYLYKSTLESDQPVTLTFALDSTQIVDGTYDILEDEQELPEVSTSEVIVGTCESQLFQILNQIGIAEITNFRILLDWLNQPIKLDNEDEYGMILEIKNNSVRYQINIYSETPIEYVDFFGYPTTFRYNQKSDIRVDNPPYLMRYEGINEKPKIISDVFIERGVVSGLDNMKRLKQIKSLNELIKYGLGHYNVTTKATDILT